MTMKRMIDSIPCFVYLDSLHLIFRAKQIIEEAISNVLNNKNTANIITGLI